MDYGNILTVELTKRAGCFQKAFELDWLEYVGFDRDKLSALPEGATIKLVMKADVSEHKKLKFLGFGQPEKKK